MSLKQKIQEIMAKARHESTNITEQKLLNAVDEVAKQIRGILSDVQYYDERMAILAVLVGDAKK